MKFFMTPLFTMPSLGLMLLFSACVTDPGVSKNRGLVKNFSVVKPSKGCDVQFLILSRPDTCTTSCGTGYHLASASELTEAKKTTDAALLTKINASAGLCIDDVIVNVRPTNQIDIKTDFCSCINGKSDLISDCAAICATKPVTPAPMLYLNTIMGTDIALNTKLGNLYNWCSVPLEGAAGTPQCTLSVTDGSSTINSIPVEIQPGSNSLTANIQSLALDRTYIVKIIESKSGSNAQSKEFQIRRKTQPSEDNTLLGALKVAPISQYTCMGFGMNQNTVTGQITRNNFARTFFYFAANETPPPMPPTGGTNQSQTVCHDEQLHPGDDNFEYPRLELIPQLFAMWDKSDPRFINADSTGLVINKTLSARLLSEYNIVAQIDIFKLISYPNRPSSSATSSASIPMGIMMVPFSDKSGLAFCPTQANFSNGAEPLFNLLREYMDDTEGLFLGEKEAETIKDGASFKTVYGTMFVTETILKNYAFYIENGIKIKATPSTMNTKTIYYYWPTSPTMDPLIAGNRKLFTVRAPNTLFGNVPTGLPTSAVPTDKRIGCIPKSSN